MNRTEIEAELNKLESRLNETRVWAEEGRGPVNDAIRVAGPIFQDLVKIMQEMLTLDSKEYQEVDETPNWIIRLTPEERAYYGQMAETFPPNQVVYSLTDVEILIRKRLEQELQ
jgi:hypothetical protein